MTQKTGKTAQKRKKPIVKNCIFLVKKVLNRFLILFDFQRVRGVTDIIKRKINEKSEKILSFYFYYISTYIYYIYYIYYLYIYIIILLYYITEIVKLLIIKQYKFITIVKFNLIVSTGKLIYPLYIVFFIKYYLKLVQFLGDKLVDIFHLSPI